MDRVAAVNSAIEGRFCLAQGLGGADCGAACGGELRHARRVEGDLVVTYLRCVFCGHLTRMLEYDLQTGAHRLVEKEGDDGR